MLQVAAPIDRFPFIRKLQLHFPTITSNLAVILSPLLPGTAAAGAFFYLYFPPQMCFVTPAVAALPTCDAAVLHGSPIKLVLMQQFVPTLENATHGSGLLKYTPREAKAGGSGVGGQLGLQNEFQASQDYIYL